MILRRERERERETEDWENEDWLMMEPMMATLVFRFCVNKAHRKMTEFVSNDSVLVGTTRNARFATCVWILFWSKSDFMLYTSGFFVVCRWYIVCWCSWFIRCSGRLDGLERRKRIFTIGAKEARSWNVFTGSTTAFRRFLLFRF